MAVKNKNRGPKTPVGDPNYNPKLVNPRIDVEDLNTMIYNQGVRVRVFKTTWCPNRKSIDGAEHEIDCPLCKGTEFIDLDCQESTAFIQGQTREHIINPEQIGSNWEEQVVLGSFIAGVELSYYTKVELLDYTNLYQQLVQRQPTGMNIMAGVVPTSYDPSTHKLSFANTVDLRRVKQNAILEDSNGKKFAIDKMVYRLTEKYLILDKSNKNIPVFTSGIKIYLPDVDRLQFKAESVDVILDEDNVRYYEGEDFVVDRNGDVEWLDCGSIPESKKIYTIIYNTLVAYRAIRAIHSNRYLSDGFKKDHLEAVEAPQQWLLKKLYLFKKEDSESGMKLENNGIFPKGE